ncbi:Unknown protein [Striga hermonthica]|uniref:Uncharacterized protein n=1 Tax=Striga hermonthica TaxID=68872 RepID=A0A9N7NID5_STRHE|nr:Unknown protein [Striga hermonthica]
MNGAKRFAEAVGCRNTSIGKRSALEGSLRASDSGRSGSENVGLSNANIGENPKPRKPKGSSARFVHRGVRRGRENASSQCSSTRRYGAECRKVKEVGDLMTGEPAIEASVNGGHNYNGPKTTCTSTERPYEALLLPGIGFGPFLRSLGGRRRRPPSGGPEPSAFQNGGVQRFPRVGRRSALECKGRRELDCKTHPSSKDEIWP